MSDVAFDGLLGDVIPIFVRENKSTELIGVVNSLRVDIFFLNNQIKKAIYLACQLSLCEILVKCRDNKYLPDTKGMRELEMCGVFYHLISQNKDTYTWVSECNELLIECWSYLKNGTGRFANHVALINQSNSPNESVSAHASQSVTLVSKSAGLTDDDFNSNDEKDISDIFDIKTDGSDSELLELMTDSSEVKVEQDVAADSVEQGSTDREDGQADEEVDLLKLMS